MNEIIFRIKGYELSICFNIKTNFNIPINNMFINSYKVMNEPSLELGVYDHTVNNFTWINQGISINDGPILKLNKYIYKANILSYYFEEGVILSFIKNEQENYNILDWMFSKNKYILKCQILIPYKGINITKQIDNIYNGKINNCSNELDNIYTFINA